MVVKLNKKWCGVATVLVTLSAPVAVDGQEPNKGSQRDANRTTQAIQRGSSTAVIEALPVVLPVQTNVASPPTLSSDAIPSEAIVIQQPTMSFQAVAPIQGAASELPQPSGEFCSECDASLPD